MPRARDWPDKPMPDKYRMVVDQAVLEISHTLIKMTGDLPVEFVAQHALQLLVGQLTKAHPWLMGQIMEDGKIREAYAVAVAELPATARSG
jgi:hypothetical protein